MNQNKEQETMEGKIARLKQAIDNADAIMIGAGAGLSTSAGFTYAGERFEKYFPDFIARYRFRDMYTGGFQVMELAPEVFWAYWSRHVYVNRYMDPPKPVYSKLLSLVQGKDYFVLTTNVDHCFQKAGFDKHRLFYTQGDYGLWQCSEPCHKATYDNEATVREMVLAQGFTLADDGALIPPEEGKLKMTVPSELLPRCPVCGKPMVMNLRADGKFVEDEGWHRAAERYQNFIETRRGRCLFLELGVGFNTPGIIKYPFWNLTYRRPDAVYACLNYSEADAPEEIADRSICISGDVGEALDRLN